VQQWSLRLDELDARLRNAMRRQRQDREQRIALLHARLQRHQPAQLIRQLRTRLEFCRRQLPQLVQRNLRQQRQRWSAAAQLLNGVSPLATLQRGYAIVGNERGELLRDARNAPPGSRVTARLAHGQLHCTVNSIETDPLRADSALFPSTQPPETD
jgi:exodeoxyribonuclease VII large subunit